MHPIVIENIIFYNITRILHNWVLMFLYFAPCSHFLYFLYKKQIQNFWLFCIINIWKILVEPNWICDVNILGANLDSVSWRCLYFQVPYNKVYILNRNNKIEFHLTNATALYIFTWIIMSYFIIYSKIVSLKF